MSGKQNKKQKDTLLSTLETREKKQNPDKLGVKEIKKLLLHKRHCGTPLIPGGRGRQISVNLRPARPPRRVPGKIGLHSESLTPVKFKYF